MENYEEKQIADQDQVSLYKEKLAKLREKGRKEINRISSELRLLKDNKMMSKENKAIKAQELKESLKEARRIKDQNKPEEKLVIKEAVAYLKEKNKKEYLAKKEEYKKAVAEINAQQKKDLDEENVKFNAEISKLKSDYNSEQDQEKKNKIKVSINFAKKVHLNQVKDIRSTYGEKRQKEKDILHSTFIEGKKEIYEVRNERYSILEKLTMYAENYVYSFKLKDFLLKNGLYIIIFLFMIVCIINNPKLLSPNQIALIFKNFSTKVFFALGVAGLILFGGTDLSIGRMVTMSTLFTCMILNPSTSVKFFGISFAGVYGAIGLGGAIVVALLLSIVTCVAFSLIAGYFTAKFNIHPFITTLGTSLVIWGTMAYGTNNIKTGSILPEATNIVRNIFSTGTFNGIPTTLIFAIIAIVAVWFIWNKTKFGKDMYAVGGNREAAAVSGISVFKVTMLIFVLAGVLYGIGGFLQGLTTGSSSSSLGQGWELEAIAACVVGGISFSGGIGKVSGAVIGCLIFEILKYFLRDLANGSVDITNIFIGVIIVAAVTFDSIKYLKKR